MTPQRAGFFFAIAAYGAWGFLPAFWRVLREVAPERIFGYRVIWSAAFYFLILVWRQRAWKHKIPKQGIPKQGIASQPQLRQSGGLRPLMTRAREYWPWILLSSLLISSNWFVYVLAVNTGKVLQASLGYFINPLVNVLLGTLFLRERLRPVQWFAVGLAGAGVTFMAMRAGETPWLSLFLAFSFGFYALCRKKMSVDPLVISTLETGWLALPALAIVPWVEAHSTVPLTGFQFGWLVLGGIATGLPLLWFAEAAKRLPLSAMGFLQYLSPSLQFSLAVFAYGEAFTHEHALSFGLIWVALGVFTYDLMRRLQARGVRS